MSAGNMEQMPSVGDYGKVVQDAGKYGTGAKRGEQRNGCQARENSCKAIVPVSDGF